MGIGLLSCCLLEYSLMECTFCTHESTVVDVISLQERMELMTLSYEVVNMYIQLDYSRRPKYRTELMNEIIQSLTKCKDKYVIKNDISR